MTDLLPTFSGETQLMGWGESDIQGPWIKLRLIDADALLPFRGMTKARGDKAGQRLACVLVEIGEDEVPVQAPGSAVGRYIETGEASQETRNSIANNALCKVEKPFGKQASELYRTGFFYVPAVLEAIGTDAEFLDWIRAQPCAVTGERDYHKDEATGTVTERCDPAHVRTVANGAGTGIKPSYCAIPLVHSLHDLETSFGKAALYVAAHANKRHDERPEETERLASEWMDKQRNEYVVAWASKTLAAHFKQPSMGFVPPTDMRLWAKEHSVAQWLPVEYR